jgi:hypothetical protein
MSTATAPAPVAPQQKQAPAEAFMLAAAAAMPEGVIAFALGDAEAGKNVPVTIVALSGDVLTHWFWGRIVLDLAGMTRHKDRLPLDWCHDPDQIVGYLDALDTTNGRLGCKGFITPTEEGDRATKIVNQSRAGVPFEASVYWEPGRIDYLDSGFTATVNGREVEGPCYIATQWRLRGVAVCPWGVDPNTSTQFSGRAAAQRPITIHPHQGVPMSTANPNPTPGPTPAPGSAPAPQSKPEAFSADAGAQTVPAPVTPSGDGRQADGAKFMQTFGEQRGALYFAKGMSFEQATQEHLKWQAQQIEQLSAKPSTPATGGAAPVPFDAADANQPKTSFASAFRLAGKK